eukprot:TRINITY_DN2033_c9_g1_i1.p1 TRINITY_DN2033_c9_g1~~TRINITY_DN2033_c9_g1_i1.p1  ORF type:complete len:591 (+),score=117.24 TRINITY_DN2033_c9_g1_i1:53-1774(+)
MAVAEARGILTELGQGDLLKNENSELAEQIVRLNNQYPGGLKNYVSNAKRLLEESKTGKNSFEGCTPEVPTGATLTYGSKEWEKYENLGLAEVKKSCFVLVAGGLGERLGYSGIKLELPVELSTGRTYLQYYIDCLDALGDPEDPIPLAIMTSGDTHDKTVALLEKNNYFGRSAKTVLLMKQEQVPSILDNNGTFVIDSDTGLLETKPHGHGDVHQLLHSTGIAKTWNTAGRKWVFFIQDTNAMVFFTTQCALGVSAELDLEVNSVCIARKPKEAIGGIARLTKKDGTPPVTICVEYNQLDPILRDYNGEGDVADETGLSPYPGNINTLLFKIPEYCSVLERSMGLMPEFVNPKYANAEKTVFKKPTRLECMMQDYPKLLDAKAKVGFTSFERWVAFSPLKNNVVDAATKVKDGLDAGSASTAESDFFYFTAKRMSLSGQGNKIEISDSSPVEYSGIPVPTNFPKISLHPSAVLTSKDFCKCANMTISATSTLVLDAANIKIEGLDLDGALVVRAPSTANVVIKNLKVQNKGWELTAAAEDASEIHKIRGYVVKKNETREIVITEPGDHIIDQ